MKISRVFLLLPLIFFLGCKTLPSSKLITESRWGNYDAVQKSYDTILIGRTTVNELERIGFHPSVTANIQILNYLDIINIFMPKDGVVVNKKVKECIDANSLCFGYKIELEDIRQERYGNAFLDIFGFRKNTRTTGWKFDATLLIKDDKVIYKIKHSQPSILSKEEKKIPLGPFQSSEGIIREVID